MNRAAALCAALLLGGCGYTLGYRTPAGVRTVAVPLFLNATFPLRREIEMDLTSAFRREIQARTGLRIVDESGSPDMVVRGRILEFRERVVAEADRNVKTESNIVSTVEIQMENYVDGTLHVQTVHNVEPFSIQSGETFETGRNRAIGNIAEKLLIAVEDWGEEEGAEEAGR